MLIRFSAAAAVLLAILASAPAEAQLRPREGDLKVGDVAPDFKLQDVEGLRAVTLADLKGKPVALIFGSCT